GAVRPSPRGASPVDMDSSRRLRLRARCARDGRVRRNIHPRLEPPASVLRSDIYVFVVPTVVLEKRAAGHSLWRQTERDARGPEPLYPIGSCYVDVIEQPEICSSQAPDRNRVLNSDVRGFLLPGNDGPR